jgi:hypothetical protein
MVRLLHPGGVFIASIAGDMSVERNLEALRSLSGLDVLADCLNPTTDSLWNKHLFVAQALEPTTPKVRSGTA